MLVIVKFDIIVLVVVSIQIQDLSRKCSAQKDFKKDFWSEKIFGPKIERFRNLETKRIRGEG